MKYLIMASGAFLTLLGGFFVFLWTQTHSAGIGALVMLIPAGVYLLWKSKNIKSGISIKEIRKKKPENEPNSIVWYAKLIGGVVTADMVEFAYVESSKIPTGSRPKSVRNLNNKKFHYLKNNPREDGKEGEGADDKLEMVILPDKRFISPRIFIGAIKMQANSEISKYTEEDFQLLPVAATVGLGIALLIAIIATG